MAAISAVLSRYQPDLIRDVTDPNTGIQTTEKFETFLPNSGELKRYCDAEQARRDRLQELGKLPRVDFNRPRLPPPPPAPGDRATIFVPASNSRYAALLEWSKTADPMDFKFEPRPGIWVSWNAWDSRQSPLRMQKDDRPTSFQLSEVTRKAMADRDAERNRTLPIDMPQEFVD